MDNSIVPHIMTIILLFLIASCSGILLKKLKFPYTIGLVIVGILFAFIVENVDALKVTNDIGLSHDIILYILLPTLIFEAAVNIDSRLLLKNLLPVCALAMPGLIISTVLIGFGICAATPLNLGAAMLFGALISATDPVAVIALFKEVGAPKRLTMLVDGESLFNDATAIVAFNIILGILISGTALNMESIGVAGLDFLFVFVGGLVVGLLIGYFVTILINLSHNEPLIQVALSTITAYTAFIVADHYLEVSGVMSTLGAGLMLSWYGNVKLNSEVKEYMNQFWEFASFAANSFIFLLLGITEWKMLIGHGHSPNILYYLALTIIIVTLARAVVVYGLIPLLKFIPKYEKISLKYQTVIFWGGLRGAVPLALVLSLDTNFPYHQLITEFTLGIVLFTLLIQGTTTKPLMSLFKLDEQSIFDKIVLFRGKLRAAKTALAFIEKLIASSYIRKEVLTNEKTKYEKQIENLKNEIITFQDSNEFDLETRKKLLWSQAVSFELISYNSLFEHGLISESIIRELRMNCELELDQIKEGIFPELQITAMPLELKIKYFLAGIVKRMLPKSKFIKLMRKRTLASKYEMTLALINANDHITEQLDKMPKLHNTNMEIHDDCRRFYKKRSELAIMQRHNLEKYDPELALQSHTVQRAALEVELELINELSEKGNISDVLKGQLKEEIESKIEAL